MKPHTIELQDVINFQQEEKQIFAHSSKENKSLYCTLRGNYEVWHNGKKILECMQAYNAVEKYNSINSK